MLGVKYKQDVLLKTGILHKNPITMLITVIIDNILSTVSICNRNSSTHIHTLRSFHIRPFF